jgi:hypothetical protein
MYHRPSRYWGINLNFFKDKMYYIALPTFHFKTHLPFSLNLFSVFQFEIAWAFTQTKGYSRTYPNGQFRKQWDFFTWQSFFFYLAQLNCQNFFALPVDPITGVGSILRIRITIVPSRLIVECILKQSKPLNVIIFQTIDN